MFNLPPGSSVFLIGIGGVGMTPLALFLQQMSYQVSGSDIQPFRMSGLLEKNGIRVFPSHKAEHIKGAQLVIYSTAIPSQNSEYQKAQEQNIRCMNRLEAVSSIVHHQKLLSVTGSYGKSTTTTFCAGFANMAGLDPSYLIGADLMNFSPARWNKGLTEWFIFETDESRPEFLRFTPYSCVLTNIGRDHLQNYHDNQNKLEDALFRFISATNPKGCIILSQEAYNSLYRYHSSLPDRVILCGSDEACLYHYKINDCFFRDNQFETRFDLTVKGETYKNVILRMPGEKYVLDAVLSYALISESAGIFLSPNQFADLPIPDRRFQLKKQWESSLLIDDEGDSPDVIEEVLRNAKKLYPTHILVPVIQPHRYSRLEKLFEEYAKVLACHSDRIILLPVYPAGEKPLPGFDSSTLANQLRLIGFSGELMLADNHPEAARKIQEWKKERCVFILLGPGDVWQVENAL